MDQQRAMAIGRGSFTFSACPAVVTLYSKLIHDSYYKYRHYRTLLSTMNAAPEWQISVIYNRRESFILIVLENPSVRMMKRKIKGALMKRITALLTGIVLCQLLVSCDSGWPYKPVQFIAPEPPPPKHAFIPTAALDSFCGTGNVTLLYTYSIQGVMTQTIYYVHLSDSDATPVKLKKPAGREGWKAESPMPSPDGKLVTYYLFPPIGHSAAYIQKLDSTSDPVPIAEPGSDPHFYKDQQGKLFVTYADTTEMLNNLLSITSRATYMKQVDATSGQVIDSVGKIASHPLYGGISRDGRYMCTGYADTYIYDRTDSAYFPINANKQTCNPSMSTDSALTDRMMFLSFAGAQNLNGYPQTALGMHKVIFIVDKTNTVINSFDVNAILGASKGEWQCPEWSNNPDYFAALASDAGNYDIYLVNIKTKKALRINTDNFRVNASATPYIFIVGGAS
jgi:hypothetical protein